MPLRRDVPHAVARTLAAAPAEEAEKGNEFVLTLTAFGEAMRERGFETKRSNGKWYLGIALQSD